MIADRVPRRAARMLLALGSLAFVVGGVLIFRSADRIGDALMVSGGLALLIGAIILANKPTGDQDARG